MTGLVQEAQNQAQSSGHHFIIGICCGRGSTGQCTICSHTIGTQSQDWWLLPLHRQGTWCSFAFNKSNTLRKNTQCRDLLCCKVATEISAHTIYRWFDLWCCKKDLFKGVGFYGQGRLKLLGIFSALSITMGKGSALVALWRTGAKVRERNL